MFDKFDKQILEVRKRVREVVRATLGAGKPVRLLGIIQAEAAPMIWQRKATINPHTGLPNRGKKQPAGAKFARQCAEFRFAKRN